MRMPARKNASLKPVWPISVFSLAILAIPGALGGYLVGRLTDESGKWSLIGALVGVVIWGVFHLLYSFDLVFYQISLEDEESEGAGEDKKTKRER